MSSKNDETVKVVVRVRPMSADEERNGNQISAEVLGPQCMITLRNPKADENEPVKQFTFDAVFGPNDTQKGIYDVCASSMVESVLNGYNGTFFAYGQTGAGKTHTMEGRPDPPHLRGIIPNSFQHIFEHVSNAQNVQFLVRASYLEIYNEEIRDLLSKDPKNSLELKENIDSGVYVKDLTSVVVKNVTEIDHVMQSGKKNRSVGATLMNQTSSRSHSIFTIVIECAESDKIRGDHIRVGKLNLVDLAGSERQSKTGATGDRLKEATNINLSLTSLGNVINALVDGKSTHIPYRDSKLTRLLQNSLGGNSKTVMCANCGPADYNYAETLSTLRYANRAKNIKNKPKINEDPKDAMLREYQDEIKRLKEQLDATQRGMVIDENGKQVMARNARTEIVEKIVEREKIIHVGISEEEKEKILKKADEDKATLMKQAQDDMKQLIEAQSRTAQERMELEEAYKREAEDRRKLEEQKEKLALKLKSMEEKLIKGGEMLSKVSEQEVQLRSAQQELREHAEQQAKLARELAEKEEANLQLEEHFSSLQEEVEVKTKKLKKLLSKYQAAVREAQDLQSEFQTERTDLLDTIRQLTRTMKLKELIIANFIPEEYAKSIEKRAQWKEEEDNWVIQKLDLSGNKLRNTTTRPQANPKARRPESEYSRQRRQHDASPRYRQENIINLELDGPEKTTQDYEGPGMVSRVDAVLGMSIHGDDGEEINFNSDSVGISNPYLQYNENGTNTSGNNGAVAEKTKSKSKKSSTLASTTKGSNGVDINGAVASSSSSSSSSSSRPKSASRRREGDGTNGYSKSNGVIEENSYRSSQAHGKSTLDDDYPMARNGVRK